MVVEAVIVKVGAEEVEGTEAETAEGADPVEITAVTGGNPR